MTQYSNTPTSQISLYVPVSHFVHVYLTSCDLLQCCSAMLSMCQLTYLPACRDANTCSFNSSVMLCLGCVNPAEILI